jgi:hypothetical protein
MVTKILSLIIFSLFMAVVVICSLIALFAKILKKKSFRSSFKILFVDIFIKGILKEVFNPKYWFEEE